MSEKKFNPMNTSLAGAQCDMRQAYYGGAPGMLTSALVWAVAAIVCFRVSPERAIWTLFVGGMFIHPVAVVLNKLMGRSGQHLSGNPLGTLALATTFWMILAFPLAYAASLVRIEWFFPAMLFIIGGRYLTFSTIYGTRIYWACGAALALAGYFLAQNLVAPGFAAAAGAAIEAVFAIVIFQASRRESDTTVLAQSA